MIRQGLMWSGLIFAITAAITWWAWGQLPAGEEFAVHWNLEGEPNRYAGKAEALLALPAIMVGFILLFTALPFVDPRKENLYKSRMFYLSGWIGGVGIAALSQISIIHSAITGEPPSVELVLAGTSIFFIVLGNFMAKSKSNWFAGIRTPWTLDSEHAWSVANRYCGWGMAFTGLLSLAVLFFGDVQTVFVVLLAGPLASILIAMVLSYFVWRAERNRERDD